jgi:hypothetical protein
VGQLVPKDKDNMVIYIDTPAIIREKGPHVKKPGGRVFGGFGVFNGDIPVARFNETTGKLEEVVNPRGNSYAHRNAARYRRKK